MRSDVAVLVVDPFELGDHELRLANLALQSGKPVVLTINKWDLVPDETLKEFEKDIAQALGHISFAPKVYTSAVNAYGLHDLLAAVIRVYDTARFRVPTSDVNNWLDAQSAKDDRPATKP